MKLNGSRHVDGGTAFGQPASCSERTSLTMSIVSGTSVCCEALHWPFLMIHAERCKTANSWEKPHVDAHQVFALFPCLYHSQCQQK
jgi:hypothetical protein